MTDTLDFVKNLWGGMNVPGMNIPGVTGPVMSTDDLDKRITDLKAIESWLNMNATMLRGTIQALEVQRGTVAGLQAMSASLAQAMRQASGDDKSAPGAAAPFAGFFGQPGAGAAQRPSGAAAGEASKSPAEEIAAGALPAANAWWNLLQEQFKQAVASTMSPEAMANAAALAQDAAARFSAAPRASGDSSGASTSPALDDSPADKSGPSRSRAAKPKSDQR
jgi:hypothetical protein